jgi:hypothetical protein
MIGYIYKLYCDKSKEIYIGCTMRYPLCKRLHGHRSQFRQHLKHNNCFISSFYLFIKYGVCNIKIQLLEKVNINNRKELMKIEGKYIQQNDVVNKYIPGRDYKNVQKLYYLKNSNKINKDKNIKNICIKCNGKYTKTNYSKHIKTKKHLNS